MTTTTTNFPGTIFDRMKYDRTVAALEAQGDACFVVGHVCSVACIPNQVGYILNARDAVPLVNFADEVASWRAYHAGTGRAWDKAAEAAALWVSTIGFPQTGRLA